MTLFLTALDQQANQREFDCQLNSLEDSFDFLSRIVARGDTLVSAYILEDSNRTVLPVAAFDGLPLSIGIQALQQEWQSILREPQRFNPIYLEELIELLYRRLSICETSVAAHKRMVDHFTRSLEWAQTSVSHESTRSYLIHKYEDQLWVYQTQLAKARFYANLCTSRLNYLLTSTLL
ncbi:MAG: hypothetical protein EOO61_08690 [Hymenobacter sp.]|nr:MAG: hypothetical protein EOO61_08690 [Hymenobacter sp.]